MLFAFLDMQFYKCTKDVPLTLDKQVVYSMLLPFCNQYRREFEYIAANRQTVRFFCVK